MEPIGCYILDIWLKQCKLKHWCFAYFWAVLVYQQGFPFSPLWTTQQVGWGWTTSWQGTQPGPKYSMLYNVMFSSKKWEKRLLGEVAIAWRLSGHHSACGRWWVTTFATLPAPPPSVPFLFPVWCLAADLSQHTTDVHTVSPYFPSLLPFRFLDNRMFI